VRAFHYCPHPLAKGGAAATYNALLRQFPEYVIVSLQQTFNNPSSKPNVTDEPPEIVRDTEAPDAIRTVIEEEPLKSTERAGMISMDNLRHPLESHGAPALGI